MNLIRMITQMGPGGWLTFAVLSVMSVLSWAVIGQKYFQFSQAMARSKRFLESFWQSRNLENLYEATKQNPTSPVSLVFQSGYVELVKISQTGAKQAIQTVELDKIDNLERALRRSSTSEISRLEKNLAFLATTGSTAPFIGLFGTVVGIMRAFHRIGLTGSANLADVAPGISEALLATAAGLAAAIPAVVGYNAFQTRLKVVATDLENFSADMLNIVKRHFTK